MLMKQITHLEI